jgi:hypothetical protein
MDIVAIEKCLGRHSEEDQVRKLLTFFSITTKPKLPRNETDAYASAPLSGIELTFTVESEIQSAERYPEGALVLVNVRFYGVATGEFVPYAGELPNGLRFGLSKAELIARMGEPSWTNESLRRFRWDSAERRLMTVLDENERLEICSIQHVPTR